MMIHRVLLMLGVMLVAGLPLFAQDSPSPTGDADDDQLPQRTSIDSRAVMTPRVDDAVNQGLRWLAAQQQPNGSFGSFTAYQRNVGVTGLCGMAFLAGGSSPGRGPYGESVSRAMDYIVANANPSGFIAEPRTDYYHGPMYGHGFATLFLAEVYGMSPRDDLRETLSRAVQAIVDSQNDEGGWRYHPVRNDADLSVTVCQVMALRAARNSGIAVPRETIDRAVEYVRKSQNIDGGFRYQLIIGGESRFPLTAAGLVALYTAGVYEGPAIENGLKFQMRYRPGAVRFRGGGYYFYGHYYAVQAAWHAGDDVWQQWYPGIRDELLADQQRNGSWLNPAIGPQYATAMSCIILQIPNNFLPIFER